ncbi:trypsin-like cysteine/serine peptidase domain-containing protein [Cladochytrium replicatum]|nr:trypsin-like cysteine/serine peptidase domain-containing protein [Cladochytrium replicatum]
MNGFRSMLKSRFPHQHRLHFTAFGARNHHSSSNRFNSAFPFVAGLLVGATVVTTIRVSIAHTANGWGDWAGWSKPSEKVEDGNENDEAKDPPMRPKRKDKTRTIGPGFIADAVEDVMDSVVNITVEIDTLNLFGKKTLVSSGSGFAVTADGKFLTNAHVVYDDAEGGNVIITDNEGVQYPGVVHSIDFLSDLAVVQVLPDPETGTTRTWKPVKFGNNTNLRPGDWVVSIGSPFGLHGTVTAGIVSSRRRKNTEIGGRDSRVEYIQTDCVVHSGSSGGPLLNLDGEVVGINTTRAESEGISFAIRADNAKDIIHQLVNRGRVVRSWLGLRMVSLSPQVVQQLKSQDTVYDGLPHIDSGVLVTAVFPRSPAAECGLSEGDVIDRVDDTPVRSTHEILQRIGYRVGEPIFFHIKRVLPLEMDWDGRVRRYETIELDVKLTPEELLPHHDDHVQFLG